MIFTQITLQSSVWYEKHSAGWSENNWLIKIFDEPSNSSIQPYLFNHRVLCMRWIKSFVLSKITLTLNQDSPPSWNLIEISNFKMIIEDDKTLKRNMNCMWTYNEPLLIRKYTWSVTTGLNFYRGKGGKWHIGGEGSTCTGGRGILVLGGWGILVLGGWGVLVLGGGEHLMG